MTGGDKPAPVRLALYQVNENDQPLYNRRMPITHQKDTLQSSTRKKKEGEVRIPMMSATYYD
jgi:hypothetical protein